MTRLAVGAAVAVAVLALVPANLGVALLGLLALPLLFRGLRVQSRPQVLLGVGVLFGAIVIAGVGDLRPELLLVATGAMVLAWDSASHAVDLRAQLDGTAESRRSRLAHSGATVAVTALLAAVVYAVSLPGVVVSPLAALLVLVGGVFVAVGLS